MITHEIRKPYRYGYTPPINQRSGNFPVTVTSSPSPSPSAGGFAHRPLQQQPGLNPVDWRRPSDRPEVTENKMMKVDYAKWIGGVEKLFPKGTLVALRITPILLEAKNPPHHFTVLAVQEIHHMATWDIRHNEPRALWVQNSQSGDTFWMAPSAVRPLTPLERELVNLRNQKTRQQPAGEPVAESNSDAPSNEGYSG